MVLTDLSEKLDEVVMQPVFYLSFKHVSPHRRHKPTKETLVNLDFGSDNQQRLSLAIDRRTKRGKFIAVSKFDKLLTNYRDYENRDIIY